MRLLPGFGEAYTASLNQGRDLLLRLHDAASNTRRESGAQGQEQPAAAMMGQQQQELKAEQRHTHRWHAMSATPALPLSRISGVQLIRRARMLSRLALMSTLGSMPAPRAPSPPWRPPGAAHDDKPSTASPPAASGSLRRHALRAFRHAARVSPAAGRHATRRRPLYVVKRAHLESFPHGILVRMGAAEARARHTAGAVRRAMRKATMWMAVGREEAGAPCTEAWPERTSKQQGRHRMPLSAVGAAADGAATPVYAPGWVRDRGHVGSGSGKVTAARAGVAAARAGPLQQRIGGGRNWDGATDPVAGALPEVSSGPPASSGSGGFSTPVRRVSTTAQGKATSAGAVSQVQDPSTPTTTAAAAASTGVRQRGDSALTAAVAAVDAKQHMAGQRRALLQTPCPELRHSRARAGSTQARASLSASPARTVVYRPASAAPPGPTRAEGYAEPTEASMERLQVALELRARLAHAARRAAAAAARRRAYAAAVAAAAAADAAGGLGGAGRGAGADGNLPESTLRLREHIKLIRAAKTAIAASEAAAAALAGSEDEVEGVAAVAAGPHGGLQHDSSWTALPLASSAWEEARTNLPTPPLPARRTHPDNTTTSQQIAKAAALAAATAFGIAAATASSASASSQPSPLLPPLPIDCSPLSSPTRHAPPTADPPGAAAEAAQTRDQGAEPDDGVVPGGSLPVLAKREPGRPLDAGLPLPFKASAQMQMTVAGNLCVRVTPALELTVPLKLDVGFAVPEPLLAEMRAFEA